MGLMPTDRQPSPEGRIAPNATTLSRLPSLIESLIRRWSNAWSGFVPAPFMIIGQPRCGTNTLCEYLDSHPDAICHKELFTHGANALSSTDCDCPVDCRMNAPELWSWIYRQRPGIRAVGWKWLSYHDPEFGKSFRRNPNVFKILIHRRSKLRQYLSNELSREYNLWHLRSPEEAARWRQERRPIRVDTTLMLRRINTWTRKEQYWRRKGVLRGPVLSLHYEDFYGPLHDEQYRMLLDFLGLRQTTNQQLPSKERTNPDPWRDLIANPKDVDIALRPTPFAHMLDDL